MGDRGYASLGCGESRLSRDFGRDGEEIARWRAEALGLSFRGLRSNERLVKSGGKEGEGLLTHSRLRLLVLALALRAGVEIDLRTRFCLFSTGGTLNEEKVSALTNSECREKWGEIMNVR